MLPSLFGSNALLCFIALMQTFEQKNGTDLTRYLNPTMTK